MQQNLAQEEASLKQREQITLQQAQDLQAKESYLEEQAEEQRKALRDKQIAIGKLQGIGFLETLIHLIQNCYLNNMLQLEKKMHWLLKLSERFKSFNSIFFFSSS